MAKLTIRNTGSSRQMRTRLPTMSITRLAASCHQLAPSSPSSWMCGLSRWICGLSSSTSRLSSRMESTPAVFRSMTCSDTMGPSCAMP